MDVHTFTINEQGKLAFGEACPPDSLDGKGSILGCAVRCITPEWLVRFHTGYDVDETDFRDVLALCQRFGIALPEEYHRFEE